MPYDYAIGLDVETTGSVLGLHALLAVGVAVVDLKTGTLVRSKRWVIRNKSLRWEPRCVTEFWSKHADALEELTAVTQQTHTLKEFAQDFVTFMLGYENSIVVSDFLLFDGQWVNHALSVGKRSPLYLPGNKSWQSTVDLDSFEDGLKAAGVLPVVDMSDVPPPNHRPEVDAAFVAIKYARIVAALSVHNSC
jgi:hypothetical protein